MVDTHRGRHSAQKTDKMETLTSFKAENKFLSTEINCTGGLSGLHSCSKQSSQQFGYRHSDVVVGSFEGPEAQSGHVLQLTGPQECRLPLQLQQTLTETDTAAVSFPTHWQDGKIINMNNVSSSCQDTPHPDSCYLGSCTAHSHGSVCQTRSRRLVNVTVTRYSASAQTSQDLLHTQHDLISTLRLRHPQFKWLKLCNSLNCSTISNSFSTDVNLKEFK